MADSELPLLRVICGPTAAGKTTLALRLAEGHRIGVVGADSRQLYRGFDIGTAKPNLDERAAVPHLGIDVLEPTVRASAAWWAGHAEGWIRHVLDDGRTPVIVGGTGLYLRALLGALFDEPPMDPAQRQQLQQELANVPTEELRRRVMALDPPRARFGRTQLLRAIEVATLTGRRVSELHAERRRAPKWRGRYLLVDPGSVLSERIENRADMMLEAGWELEVRQLAGSVPADAPAWNATGYRTVRAVVEGRKTLAEAREEVVVQTRQYAKRQRTWFRHQLAGEDVTRLDPQQPDIDRQLAAWWQGSAA